MSAADLRVEVFQHLMFVTHEQLYEIHNSSQRLDVLLRLKLKKDKKTEEQEDKKRNRRRRRRRRRRKGDYAYEQRKSWLRTCVVLHVCNAITTTVPAYHYY